jgi:hypothetical protein
LEAEKVK